MNSTSNNQHHNDKIAIIGALGVMVFSLGILFVCFFLLKDTVTSPKIIDETRQEDSSSKAELFELGDNTRKAVSDITIQITATGDIIASGKTPVYCIKAPCPDQKISNNVTKHFSPTDLTVVEATIDRIREHQSEYDSVSYDSLDFKDKCVVMSMLYNTESSIRTYSIRFAYNDEHRKISIDENNTVYVSNNSTDSEGSVPKLTSGQISHIHNFILEQCARANDYDVNIDLSEYTEDEVDFIKQVIKAAEKDSSEKDPTLQTIRS